VTTRQEREKEFHNELFAQEEGRPADAFYAINESSFAFYEKQIAARGAGKRVLEYGCGRTSYAVSMASQGARVTGIDISEVAVELSTERVHGTELEDRVDFRVMDAEDLDLDGERFDLVCGTGILHHLDLDRAFAAIASALAPGGSAVFLEPLGHNPLVNLYRRATPSQRSEDEHPLLMDDLRRAGSYFGCVEARFFHLSSLLALAVRGRPGFDAAVRSLDALDRKLFRIVPPSRAWAWITVMVLTGHPPR
jgi:SAM-dependent methyltransferase